MTEDRALRAWWAARGIALGAHAGAIDQAGEPYIEHVARVAEAFPAGSTEGIVAWLHDVVEDTALTEDDLAAFGAGNVFTGEVIEAVVAISRREGEKGSRADTYYERVRANPTALAVKLADIADNTNVRRLAMLGMQTRERLIAKYAHALEMLS